MTSRARHLLAVVVLLGAGFLRMPVEKALVERFRREHLLTPPLEIEVREKIGQTSSAVALGGLRTLVASLLHIGSMDEFSRLDADGLADIFETIVQLAPRSRYYWDVGAWHIRTNAPSWTRNDSELPPIRRQTEWRRWIERGNDFLERGLRNNPDDAILWAVAGRHYLDPFTIPDPAKAEAAFARSIELGIGRPHIHRAHLLAMAAAGRNPSETRDRLDALLVERTNRVPTLLALRFALESKLSPPADPMEYALGLFGDERRAYRVLSSYFLDSLDSRLPVDGIEPLLRRMEAAQGIPPENPESIIHQYEELLSRNDPFRPSRDRAR